MAKAKVRDGRHEWEIGQAIIAAWYKVLPEEEGGPIGDIDDAELTTLFNQILETPCVARIDPKGGPIVIQVPQPPETVKSRQSLVEYQQDYLERHYYDDLATAVLFGCGK